MWGPPADPFQRHTWQTHSHQAQRGPKHTCFTKRSLKSHNSTSPLAIFFSFSHSQSQSLFYSFLSKVHSHSLTHSLSHTHTHTYTHTLTHTHYDMSCLIYNTPYGHGHKHWMEGVFKHTHT